MVSHINSAFLQIIWSVTHSSAFLFYAIFQKVSSSYKLAKTEKSQWEPVVFQEH